MFRMSADGRNFRTGLHGLVLAIFW
eukprot:COSAG02_NODE_68422_length_245_cov_122.054795_1_plen_24_part_10